MLGSQHMLAFYMGSEDLNSGPHASITSTIYHWATPGPTLSILSGSFCFALPSIVTVEEDSAPLTRGSLAGQTLFGRCSLNQKDPTSQSIFTLSSKLERFHFARQGTYCERWPSWDYLPSHTKALEVRHDGAQPGCHNLGGSAQVGSSNRGGSERMQLIAGTCLSSFV